MQSIPNILDAWIMVEHLTEGTVEKKDSVSIQPESGEYYQYFVEELEKEKKKRGFKVLPENAGLIVYFDIFEFKEVVEFLRSKYQLQTPEENISYGLKFSLALYFDKNLELDDTKTFYTESAYIRKFQSIPDEEVFKKYEGNVSERVKQLFEPPVVDPDDPDKIPNHFNEAFDKLLKKYEFHIENCRYQYVNNLENDSANLHSFFIKDLEKAKISDFETRNLDNYLLGCDKSERINLDGNKESDAFDKKIFEKILSPENFPLGRFPSNTKYALAFMQQVAVNLSIGFDNRQMRSVNGPPGTGKTTLLKDIFADLIVEQAQYIAALSNHKIAGSSDTVYWNNQSIGLLDDHLAENNILVASSNNGAVQNIVKELPLNKEIDENLLKELQEADYFREIANSDVTVEWHEDKKSGKKTSELKMTPLQGDQKYWGLFSLEGGAKKNTDAIINRLRAIQDYFSKEYVPVTTIYKDFLKQYNKVKELRDSVNESREQLQKYAELESEKEKKQEEFQKAAKEEAAQAERDNQQIDREEAALIQRRKECTETLARIDDDLKIANQRKNDAEKRYYAIKSEKRPGFFHRAEQREYDQRLANADHEWQECLHKANKIQDTQCKANEDAQRIEKSLQDLGEKRNIISDNLHQSELKREREIQRLVDQMKEMEEKYKPAWDALMPIDFDASYEELQQYSPWFDEDFRKEQSRLFIMALRVRKQFLYENMKNLQAASNIWNHQKDYLDNQKVIECAWNWINIAVPVISTTFASLGRMLQNIGPNVLGHLFIDEAGQALPQAAVGGIMRFRHVMVVGDPSQIKPVLTLEGSILKLLGKHYNVGEKYLSEDASVQTLVDAVSQYGFYKEGNPCDPGNDSWIGIPLWVHRRCQCPMFTISNRISYNDFMVLVNMNGNENGKAGWFDVSGKANDKYVAEQGEFLKQKILEMSASNPDILDKNKKDTVFVISPFRNVAYQLAKKLEGIGFTRRDDSGKPTNIGTIHTFQGKEAPIVFLVLGADQKSAGAASWAVREPNMMNVAATRAKKEFYIIGDKKLYSGLRSSVIADTLKILNRYKKEHPDLVEECSRTEQAAEETAQKPQLPVSPVEVQNDHQEQAKTIYTTKEYQDKTAQNRTYQNEYRLLNGIISKIECIYENGKKVDEKVLGTFSVDNLGKYEWIKQHLPK
jgi:hypothetical protein